MAYITVTTPVDVVAPGDGKLSLREAITQANGSSGPDTIRFTATIVGQTLVLTSGELAVTDDLTINGRHRTTTVSSHDRRQSHRPHSEYHRERAPMSSSTDLTLITGRPQRRWQGGGSIARGGQAGHDIARRS